MTRLFVALKIPPGIRDEIISLRKKVWEADDKFRWERKDKLHLTLKFIGEVEDDRIEEILSDFEFINGFGKFNCSLSEFGFFQQRGTPKILWIGLHTSEKLITLAGRLNSSLEKFAIPRETKKFKTHITILRLKGNPGEKFIKGFENFNVPQVRFVCDTVAVYKSELKPGGSVYTEIKNYKLKDMEEG